MHICLERYASFSLVGISVSCRYKGASTYLLLQRKMLNPPHTDQLPQCTNHVESCVHVGVPLYDAGMEEIE